MNDEIELLRCLDCEVHHVGPPCPRCGVATRSIPEGTYRRTTLGPPKLVTTGEACTVAGCNSGMTGGGCDGYFVCDACDGSGYRIGLRGNCPPCGGCGWTKDQPWGQRYECDACGGTGSRDAGWPHRIRARECPTCKRLRFEVPIDCTCGAGALDVIFVR